MREVMESVSSYLVALGAMLIENNDSILAVGGLVLLVVRLLADAPRAYRNVRKWLGY